MKAFLIDTAERTVSTYLQVLVGLLLTLGTIDARGLAVAAVAAIPAGLTVVRAVAARLLQLPVPRTLGVDLLVRVVATYVESFLGFAIATVALPDGSFHVDALGSAALAAVPAVLALAKGWLASNVGDPTSGSLTSYTGRHLRSADAGYVRVMPLLAATVLLFIAIVLAATLANLPA